MRSEFFGDMGNIKRETTKFLLKNDMQHCFEQSERSVGQSVFCQRESILRVSSVSIQE